MHSTDPTTVLTQHLCPINIYLIPLLTRGLSSRDPGQSPALWKVGCAGGSPGGSHASFHQPHREP